ncbi:MAG: hypothetical protein ACYTFG_03080 [Planctomycetota bacterium]|jgi:hypothetical protein
MKHFLYILLLFALLGAVGCGKKTAKARDDVADEVTGNRPIKQGERLKDQARKVDEDIEERRKEGR